MQQKLKRTKIVCTMGPACDNDETICEMLKAGMNVARFNFSHGSYEEHQGRIERVRRCAAKVGKPVGILLDTKGPEVRTGLLEGHAKVEVHAGDKITVTAQPTSEDWLGNASHISLDYEKLPSEAEKGSIILIDDGLVGLEVESVDGQDMHCVVLNNGLIGERKGVNIPNVDISLPAVTERDRQDILFGLTQNIDYIAASFIRNGKAVEDIRQLCRENGGEHVTIFPKIECALGVENFDEILEASDGIMVARGDLGIEIKPELVPHIQKEIIAKCNAAYKPVITATQMLDSMQQNPRPTRAEVADVANAIYDGTDAVMLSGESAAGKYPVQAVKAMAQVCEYTENKTSYHKRFYNNEFHIQNKMDSISHAVCAMAIDVNAKAIAVSSVSGKTATMVSRFRCPVDIVGLTTDRKIWRRLALSWGVTPVMVEHYSSMDVMFYHALLDTKRVMGLKPGDNVVLTGGPIVGRSGNTNTIKVEQIV